MKKINLKKYFSIFAIIAVLSPILFSFQNFRHYEAPLQIEKDQTTMNDALIEALKTAEAEKEMKKVALRIEEEENTKKNRKPSTIGDRHFLDSRTDDESQMSSQLRDE